MPSLPMPAAELAGRLNRPLAPRPGGWALTVTGAELVGPGSGSPALVLGVTGRPPAGGPAQHWSVRIPVDPQDLAPDVPAETLVVTLRANLEEWWDTRATDPVTAGWETPVPGPADAS